MSYISIRDFIQDGRKSLEAKNYWSALSVALMLPSMCSRLAYANNPDYHWKNGNVEGLRNIIEESAKSGGQNMQNAISGNKMI